MGSQKRLVQRVERKLEQTVGDAFARIFGGSIVPQEVEALLRREAADGIQSLQGNRLLAPNEYIITLGVHDFEKLGADPELKSTGFARDLADYIQEQGWQTYGDVVVRFEQSSNLHTGQFRARGTVNPDVETHPPVIDCARPQSNHAFGAEPGVAPMSDNSSYRGGQGQGRPDEYYDDRYARPQEDPRGGPDPQGGSDPRGGIHPRRAATRPSRATHARATRTRATTPSKSGTPTRAVTPSNAATPTSAGTRTRVEATPTKGRGYPPPYEQRPPVSPGPAAGYGAPGYDQGYRQSGGYGPSPGGGQPGYGGYGEYGRGPARHEEGSYVPSGPPGPPEQRPAYPDQGGYDQGYQQGATTYGRQDYGGGADYTRYTESPRVPGYAPQGGGYAEPAGRDYDYGQSGAPDYGQPAPGGYSGYGQGGYGSAGTSVTLQLDDGSGRTYQLREGSNIIGRGQDAQFRLPDTGVSRRHLEIRWDGQVALLADLNSTNGTTVNNAPVQEWQLADGDVIRLGHSEIIVRMH